jgi:hypothetical protein
MHGYAIPARVTGTGTVGYGYGSAFADPVPGYTRVQTPLKNGINEQLVDFTSHSHPFDPLPAVATRKNLEDYRLTRREDANGRRRRHKSTDRDGMYEGKGMTRRRHPLKWCVFS